MSEKDVQPVAWSVFDKRTQKHWYTNESVNTAGYYAKEYSHREADGSHSMLVVPLYTHPPVAQDVQPVGKFAQFTDGGWREVTKGSPGVPLYEHPPAADVAELVEALRGLEEVASDCDIGYMDNAVRHARRVIEKWERKMKDDTALLRQALETQK
jgi:hypothetical protein